jgi:predicted HicB family RNase H-like nuclease
MTILNYRGYQGSIEYEDGQLVIQLLHIGDFITTTCDSAAETEAAFHELVDDYLATCQDTGRAPDKPHKGSLNIRMPPELHRLIAMAATASGVSLNAWIVRACEAAISVPSQRFVARAKHPSAEHAELLTPDNSIPTIAFPKSNYLDYPRDNIVDLLDLRQISKRRFEDLRSRRG